MWTSVLPGKMRWFWIMPHSAYFAFLSHLYQQLHFRIQDAEEGRISSWENNSILSITSLVTLLTNNENICVSMRFRVMSVGTVGTTEEQEVSSEHQQTFFYWEVTGHWHRLIRKVVWSPTLEIFKSLLDLAPGNKL